jgi:hypothetical protein
MSNEKRLYIVDTISTFRLRYVVEARTAGHACDEVTMKDSGVPDDYFEEVSQKHVSEEIVDTREISMADFEKMLSELETSESESCSYWLGKKLIRTISYKDEK